MKEHIKILKHIESNPHCSSEGLDDLVVHQFVNDGLISGIDTTSSSTPEDIEYEYSDLTMTVRGKEYLANLIDGPSDFTDNHFWSGLFVAVIAMLLGWLITGLPRPWEF